MVAATIGAEAVGNATVPGSSLPGSVEETGGGGADPPHVVLRVPVDVRSVSLGVLAVLAGVFTLKWASAVFIPLLLGLMLSYSLTPIVNRLKRFRVPRAVGAAVLLFGILGGDRIAPVLAR